MEMIWSHDFYIDAEGVWFAEGLPVIRPDILLIFAENLKRNDNGDYYIDMKTHACPVRVETVPLFATSAAEEEGDILLQLRDGRKLPLPIGGIEIIDQKPYVSLFNERDTRLSRTAFQLLMEYMVEEDGCYLLRTNKGEWPVVE